MERNSVLESLYWRYAVKKFDPTQKISDPDWEVLESSLVLSPSAYGFQPWKFIVVQDPAVRKLLISASWNQTQPEECSHFVVFTSKITVTESDIDRFIQEMSAARGVEEISLNRYRNIMVEDLVRGPRSKNIFEWTARQAYLAMGTLLTTAAALKIDTCPMEGIDPGRYDEIFRLEGSGYSTLAACALGYRSVEDKYALVKKFRYATARVVEYVG